MVLGILGALGGFSAFITGVALTLKAIFRQVSATDSNTEATRTLSRNVADLTEKISHLDTRVTILEDHDRRNGIGAHP